MQDGQKANRWQMTLIQDTEGEEGEEELVRGGRVDREELASETGGGGTDFLRVFIGDPAGDMMKQVNESAQQVRSGL